ncbi:hypothetical protein B0T11DRAFT_298669 [Plectosphaerella cucumerina]|uniref:Uncharacterized protein n=1 Tax=Plectosphaerella cucumerina TaxID=40658 RepID=A0A8K0X452_9PEZI|nr:hypothetical protein B0T11DRAFT_298669 [Plectosphaerella cucumerina]
MSVYEPMAIDTVEEMSFGIHTAAEFDIMNVTPEMMSQQMLQEMDIDTPEEMQDTLPVTMDVDTPEEMGTALTRNPFYASLERMSKKNSASRSRNPFANAIANKAGFSGAADKARNPFSTPAARSANPFAGERARARNPFATAVKASSPFSAGAVQANNPFSAGAVQARNPFSTSHQAASGHHHGPDCSASQHYNEQYKFVCCSNAMDIDTERDNTRNARRARKLACCMAQLEHKEGTTRDQPSHTGKHGRRGGRGRKIRGGRVCHNTESVYPSPPSSEAGADDIN